jgi:ATP dependent DNA ligase domain
MARGGARPGAGRPFGSKDVRPRKSAYLAHLGDVAQEYDKSEYFITNDSKVFPGNALELMVQLYKAEQLPVRVRLYAASKSVEYEVDKSGHTLEELKEQWRKEQEAEAEPYQDMILDELERIRRTRAEEDQKRLRSLIDAGRLDPMAAALIEAPDAVKRQVELVLAVHGPGGDDIEEFREGRTSEIAPPQPNIVVRKIPPPPVIDQEDGQEYGSGAAAGPPEGPEWLHELKFDGYRMHARLDRGAVRLLTRTRLDWTRKYPAIAAAVETLSAQQAYLDGELCGVRPDGTTSFSLIQNASDSGNSDALVFFLFDLLHRRRSHSRATASGSEGASARVAFGRGFGAAVQRSPDRPRTGLLRRRLRPESGGDHLETGRCAPMLRAIAACGSKSNA